MHQTGHDSPRAGNAEDTLEKGKLSTGGIGRSQVGGCQVGAQPIDLQPRVALRHCRETIEGLGVDSQSIHASIDLHVHRPGPGLRARTPPLEAQSPPTNGRVRECFEFARVVDHRREALFQNLGVVAAVVGPEYQDRPGDADIAQFQPLLHQ